MNLKPYVSLFLLGSLFSQLVAQPVLAHGPEMIEPSETVVEPPVSDALETPPVFVETPVTEIEVIEYDNEVSSSSSQKVQDDLPSSSLVRETPPSLPSA